MNVLQDPQRSSTPGSEAGETEVARPSPSPTAVRPSFWLRHKTIINFWLDVTLSGLFLLIAWLLIVIQYVFPRGARGWTIWGATEDDWRDGLFFVFCVFSLAVVVHVMLHWDWICATVATRLLRRKAQKDDGSQTLLGVALLIVLIHLVIAGVLAARVSLTSPL